MDGERSSDLARGRKRTAGSDLTLCDRTPDRHNDPLVQGEARRTVGARET